MKVSERTTGGKGQKTIRSNGLHLCAFWPNKNIAQKPAIECDLSFCRLPTGGIQSTHEFFVPIAGLDVDRFSGLGTLPAPRQQSKS